MEIRPELLALLPLLILLACPLMMWWMMRGKSGAKRMSGEPSGVGGDDSDAEVQRLRTRITELEESGPDGEGRG